MMDVLEGILKKNDAKAFELRGLQETKAGQCTVGVYDLNGQKIDDFVFQFDGANLPATYLSRASEELRKQGYPIIYDAMHDFKQVRGLGNWGRTPETYDKWYKLAVGVLDGVYKGRLEYRRQHREDVKLHEPLEPLPTPHPTTSTR